MTRENEPIECPICKQSAILKFTNDFGRIKYFECQRCGSFRTTSNFGLDITPLDKKNYILSGYIREHNIKDNSPVTITSELIKEIASSFSYPRTISEKIDRIILYIGDQSKSPGHLYPFNPDDDYPIAYLSDPVECVALLKYLENKYLQNQGVHKGLTVDGWQYYETLQRNPPKTNQAFVAMWFGQPDRVERMKSIFENGINKAFAEAETSPKYTPVRIDLIEHNDPIDQKILVEIRRSRFVIADLTGNRGGVYFEAGYALSLGIPVIWMCEKGTKVHFDVGQFSRIEWENENDLYEKLKRRIEGSIF